MEMDLIAAEHSLESVERMMQYGAVTEDELATYLEKWNATPGRFTFAFWRDGAIRQSVKHEFSLIEVSGLHKGQVHRTQLLTVDQAAKINAKIETMQWQRTD